MIEIVNNTKTFVKQGKRYKIIYSSPYYEQAVFAREVYSNKITVLYYDKDERQWFVGVDK